MGELARNWWVLVVRGVLAIVFGLLCFFLPALTLAALVLVFGAYALVDGIFALVSAIARQGDRPWWALVIKGIGGMAVGVITFFWPGITALSLLFLIAGWAIGSGALEIATALRLRRQIHGEWLLVLAGAASVVFGILLAIAPGPGALAVLWIIGSYAIVFGVLFIALGVRLRAHWHHLARSEDALPHAA